MDIETVLGRFNIFEGASAVFALLCALSAVVCYRCLRARSCLKNRSGKALAGWVLGWAVFTAGLAFSGSCILQETAAEAVILKEETDSKIEDGCSFPYLILSNLEDGEVYNGKTHSFTVTLRYDSLPSSFEIFEDGKRKQSYIYLDGILYDREDSEKTLEIQDDRIRLTLPASDRARKLEFFISDTEGNRWRSGEYTVTVTEKP